MHSFLYSTFCCTRFVSHGLAHFYHTEKFYFSIISAWNSNVANLNNRAITQPEAVFASYSSESKHDRERTQALIVSASISLIFRLTTNDQRNLTFIIKASFIKSNVGRRPKELQHSHHPNSAHHLVVFSVLFVFVYTQANTSSER